MQKEPIASLTRINTRVTIIILRGAIMVEYNFKKLSKMAKTKGFEVVRIKGSHHQFLNKTTRELVTIPNHGNSPIAKGTAQKIIKALGYK